MGVHREDSQTGHSGRSPFTGINRALLRLKADVCLCVLPALCALRGMTECVCGPGLITTLQRRQTKQTSTLPVVVTEESESGRQEKKRKWIKTTDLTVDVLCRNTEKNKEL